MLRRAFPVVLFAGLVLLAPAARAAAPKLPPAQVEFFEKKVRPILTTQCIKCHGPEKQKGGLRLDSRAALLQGGESGPAVVPGKPEKSLLITAVHYDDSPRMPPRGKLKKQEVAALTTWVKLSVPWPETDAATRPAPIGKPFTISARDRAFWSFRPVANPPLPPVADPSWPRSSLDYFILNRLQATGLHPSAAADKRTLLRRVTFDLTGLPPTPAEIDAFLKDNRDDAYARVVDRLLASPRYGERWGRHWLDVARYAEDQAHTFAARLYPNGYRYRDWVVKAFNDDMPYDRFIKEQLAADVLDGPDKLERLPALGFFAVGPVYYGDPKKLDQIDDRIDTLARGFLGLTVACARCHDHKFDPIPTRDYYSLAGIFDSTDYEEAPLVSPDVVAAAKKQAAEEAKNAKNAKGKKKPKGKVVPKYPVAHALKEGKPHNLRVHIRGNPATLGEEAPRRFLAILGGGKPFAKGSGRLELAEAIASKDNPLTARVFVNRVWQHHFGKGLVRTTSNFGALGERPTHPELLDHLARRFMEHGWSIKWLHREIVLSATYQQASRHDAAAYKIDPENRLLWRMNRQRLEVEAWRDAMLAVAGTLDDRLAGPPSSLSSADNRRRTLYGSVSRHDLEPLLRLFDFPDPNITCGERTVTTVPLQQLFVLNSEFMVRNARALAVRLTALPQSDEARIRRAYLLCFGRPATDAEVRLGQIFLASADAAGSSGKSQLGRWEQFAQALLGANEFMYVD